MELNIYNQNGELKLTASTSTSSTWNIELMVENSLSVSFTHPLYVSLDVNDYVMISGIKFSINKEYKPQQKSTQKYTYSVKFYGPEHDAQRVMYLNLTDGQYAPQFSLDGSPREHLQKWVDNMNRIYGREVWSMGDVVVSPNKTIEYNNLTCWDALTAICETFETEYWADGYVINLSRCEHGERVNLGYMQGLTSLTQSENSNGVKFFTRLIPLGSAKNIDRSRYGYSRLQLPDKSTYVDRNTQYGLYEHVEENAFAEIFPHYTGTISSVRSEEKTGEDNKKFTIYYFKDETMQFDPNENEIAGLVKQLSFQSGDLNGREFEANYNSTTKEWEIINTYPSEEIQIPGGNLIPRPGDTYIPWNFRMPVEYETQAELDYKSAVDDYLQKYSEDVSKYGGDTDYIYIDGNNVPLQLGQSVRLLSDKYFGEKGYLDSRMTKIVRKLDNLSVANIECSNQVGKGWKQQVESSMSQLQYVVEQRRAETALDILKSWDGREINDYRILSALRTLKEIEKNALSRLNEDTAAEVITFLKGIVSKKVINAEDGIVARNGITTDVLEASESVTGKNITATDTVKTNAVEAAATISGKDVIASNKATTLNLLVQALADMYDLNVSHVATLMGTIVKDYISSESFVSGFAGTGMKIYRAVTGDWNMELDNLVVRKIFTVFELVVQKITHQGGMVIRSAVGGKLTKVTDGGSYWKCEHDSTDDFVKDDQVICQEFTGTKIKRYWRLVTSAGAGYFNLSKTDCEVNSGAPEAGDDVAVLGNRTNTDRQKAQVDCAFGAGAPYRDDYEGINSYSLGGKLVNRTGNLTGITDPDFGPLTGSGLYGRNAYLKGMFRLMSGKTVEDAITSSINDIQIGGRNLLLASSTHLEGSSYKINNFESSRYFTEGEELTVTIWGNISGEKLFGMWFNVGSILGAETKKVAEGIYSATLKVPAGVTMKTIGIYLVGNTGNTDSWTFERIKLETGNKYTDWTPAPEDIDTKITNVETRFEVREGQISSKVTEVTQKATQAAASAANAAASATNAAGSATNARNSADTATAKLVTITEKESSINQTAGNITLQVTEVTTKTAQATNAAELAMAMAQGRMLYRDPSFSVGTNSVGAYNNSSNGTVTISRVSGIEGNPNSSGYGIKITTIGAASPGFGGWYYATPTKANQVLIIRFIANIPEGRTVAWASNATGDGGFRKWLTPTAGTGKWEEYAYKLVCGSTGIFSTTAYFYLTGGATPTAATPLVWYLCYATIFDVTDAEIDYIADAAGKYTTKTEYATSITQLAGSIELKASKTELNALGQRITIAESAITQLPNQITLSVQESKNYSDSKVGEITRGTRFNAGRFVYNTASPYKNIVGFNTNIPSDVTNMWLLDISGYAYGEKCPFKIQIVFYPYNETLVSNGYTNEGGVEVSKVRLGVKGAKICVELTLPPIYYLNMDVQVIATRLETTQSIANGWTIHYGLDSSYTPVVEVPRVDTIQDRSANNALAEAQKVRTEYKSDFVVLSNEIKSKVSQTDFNALGQRVSSAETTITQHTNQIALKAAQTSVDALGTRITSAEAKITPDAINLVVKSQTETIASNAAKRTELWVDATTLDESKYYPVTIILSTRVPAYTITVDRTLDISYGSPSWSTHANGFSVVCRWGTNAGGWGTIDVQRTILDYAYKYVNVSPMGNIGQMTNSSTEYVYVRGGSKYRIMVEGNTGVSIALRTAAYTVSNQTIDILTTVTSPVVNMKERPTKAEIQAGISITAGAISIFGQSLSLAGKVTFSSLDSGAQSTINGKATTAQVATAKNEAVTAAASDATTKANAAEADAILSAATTAQGKVDALKNTLKSLAYLDTIEVAKLGTTVIEGGYLKTTLIKAGSIDAEKINTVSIRAVILTAEAIAALNITTSNLTVTTGAKIAGFRVSGNGLTNSDDNGAYTNDAYILFRNDLKSCFAGIGGNILPSSSGARAVARFENEDSTNQWGGNVNYACILSAKNAITNYALYLMNGFIGGMAVKSIQITGTTYLDHSDCYCSCYNTSTITVYLPSNPQTGKQVFITRINNYTVNVNGNGTQMIYSSTKNNSFPLNNTGEMCLYIYDGQYWIVGSLK